MQFKLLIVHTFIEMLLSCRLISQLGEIYFVIAFFTQVPDCSLIFSDPRIGANGQ